MFFTTDEAATIAEKSASILDKLHINLLLIGVLAIIAIGAIIGAHKGAFKMIFAVIGIVLAISLTILLSPITKSMIMSRPNLYNFFYTKTEALAEKNKWASVIANLASSKEEDTESIENSGSDSVALMNELLETMDVPESFRESIVGDESVITGFEVSADANANETAESLKKGAYTGITNLIVKAVAFIGTLLIVGIVLAMLGGITNLLGRIPGIEQANSIAGAIAGGLIGLVVVWVLFVIITMISATSIGQKMLAMINENPLLSFIYNHNFISSKVFK
jgi:uncharacterized membrane protein YuzA (DUF378 family)